MSFYQWVASSYKAHKPSPQNAKSQERREMRPPEEIILQKSIRARNSLDLYSMSEFIGEVMQSDENLNVQLGQSPAIFGGCCYSNFRGFTAPAKSGFVDTIFLTVKTLTQIVGSKTQKVDMNSYLKVNHNAQNDGNSVFVKLDLYNPESLSSLQDLRIQPQIKTILEKS